MKTLTPVLASALASLVLCACGIGYQNADTERRPEVITGMGATVMYPGESGPAMPGSAIAPAGTTTQSSGSNGPGQTSGSHSGSGQPAAGEPPPQGSNMTMISGGKDEVSESFEDKRFLPIGPLFGYPFWFLGKSLQKKADEEAKEQWDETQGAADSAAPRGNTPDDVERDRLARENQALRDQLQQRAGASNPPPPVSSAPQPRAASPRISDELAALERSLGRRAVPGTSASAAPHAARAPLAAALGMGAPEATDRDGDGRPDLWTYTKNGRPALEALDEDRDGRVDRNLHYDERGRLVSSDDDIDGDGVMESTSLYEDGRLARRRSDSDGDGQADSWSFHRGDELLRSEADRNGDGFRDEVTIYARGQIEREESDKNGDGRPDVISLYREGQLAEKREDLDFDGTPDVLSRYENGKLRSREADSGEVFERWEKAGEK